MHTATLLQDVKEKTIAFRIIVFVILFLFIFSQVISMTRFLWDYNYCRDYGRMLKSMCRDAYTEFETPRFQLFNKSSSIRLTGDEYDAENIYNTIILISVIVVTLYVAFMFWYIFLYVSINSFKDYGLQSFKQIKGFEWVRFILSLYIILVIPAYISLKLSKVADISPFQLEQVNYSAHTICMGLVSFVFWWYCWFSQESSMESGIVLLFGVIMVGIYIAVCYILTFVCDIYTNRSYGKKPDEPGFKTQYMDEERTDDLLQKFFGDIFGVNDMLQYKSNVFRTHKYIVFGLFGYCIGMAAIGLILNLLGYFNDKLWLLYYLAFLPFLILFIIMFMGVMHIEYNTYINKYLLFKPEQLYKQILNRINNIFNQLLVNDKSNILDKSVCYNIANAIQLSIYSDLFKIPDIQQEDKKTLVKDDLKALFIPAFKFTRECDDSLHIDYNKIEAYNIDYYINDDKNMFYTNNKDCSGIRNGLLFVLMFNCIYNGVKPVGVNEIKDTKRQDSFEKWLKYTINNVYNLRKHYTGTENIDFEDVNIYTKSDVTSKTAENKFGPHIDGVITDVGKKYDEYLRKMYLEVVKTVKALCKCNGLPDITKNDSITNFKGDLLKYILEETDGTYSKNIKKDFINVFVINTSELLSNVNKLMSSQVVETDHNYRLTKLIIKNYNRTIGGDDEGSNKFLYSRLYEETLKTNIKKEDTIISVPFKHIESIEKNTSNVVFENGDIQKVKDDFNNFKNEYELVYKQSALLEMLYKYKVDYVNKNIADINSDDKDNKQSKYKDNYKDYTDKYNALTLIAGDAYKNALNAEINKLPDDIEASGKSLSKAADTSTQLTYFIFIVYIFAITLTVVAVR